MITSKIDPKYLKAEITVVFKTADLFDDAFFTNKYNRDIVNAVKDIISNYSLLEIVDKEYAIKKIRIAD